MAGVLAEIRQCRTRKTSKGTGASSRGFVSKNGIFFVGDVTQATMENCNRARSLTRNPWFPVKNAPTK